MFYVTSFHLFKFEVYEALVLEPHHANVSLTERWFASNTQQLEWHRQVGATSDVARLSKLGGIPMATKTKINVRPLGDRVIITALPQEEMTKGGIILPDTAKEKPQQGEVVAVGKGKISDTGETVPMTVKAGDKVLYGKYSGTEVKIDGIEYLIVKESEILAIIA